MPDYQPLHCYEHFNILRCCTILYGISSYKPYIRLLPTLGSVTAKNWAYKKVYLDIGALDIVWSIFFFSLLLSKLYLSFPTV